jgi:hypothetical protein
VEARQQRFQVNGVEVVSRDTVTFLQPAVVAPGDQLEFPDGRVGPVLAVEGLMDPAAKGKGYYAIAWVGV